VRAMKILVVEDHKKTAKILVAALAGEGFKVKQIGRGDEVLQAVKVTRYDAIILDVMLPGQNGLSVVKDLREAGFTTPILLLSARGELSDRVEGLNAGAEDYLPKPFALSELIARVRSLGRRGAGGLRPQLKVGDLELNAMTRLVTRGGVNIELTAREFRLLEFLMNASGRICSRTLILEKVWDYHFDPGTNLVDVYIRKLREKIDQNFEIKLLHSVRHEGYYLKAPKEEK